jgi:hypothetical protein
VLNNGLGHVEDVWDRPEMQKMLVEQVKWVLGLVPGEPKCGAGAPAREKLQSLHGQQGQKTLKVSLNPLQHHRHALPHSDAHGGQGITRLGALELARRGQH